MGGEVKSNSELKTARACLQKHNFQYVQLRRPIKVSDALTFGTLVHTGLEAVFLNRHKSAEEQLLAACEAMTSQDPYALATARELIAGYIAYWLNDGLETVAVEHTFSIPLQNPDTGETSEKFVLGGKFDGIVRSEKGLHVIEHKTTSEDIEEGSRYWQRVKALDTQVSQYIAGAKASGFDVVDCIYDVIKKPTIRPAKATPEHLKKYTKQGFLYANQRENDETPEEFAERLRADIAENPNKYFARGHIVRLESEEKSFARDVWGAVYLLDTAVTNGYTPKNPDSCSEYGGCPYLAVCSGEASIHDDNLFRTAAQAHEELATP